jgi:hypothetical protein
MVERTQSDSNENKDNELADKTYRNAIRTYHVHVTTVYLLALYTTATLVLAYWAWRSADIAQRTLETTERPWITEENIKVPFVRFDARSGATGAISISLKNIGKSVAVNVHPFCNIGALKYGEPIQHFEDSLCGQLGEQTEQDSSAGYMIFPDETLSWTQSIAVSENDIIQAKTSGSSEFSLVCCVDYRFAFAPEHHQTRRAFDVGHREPPPSLGWKPIVTQGTIYNPDLIQLFWGNWAS